MRKGNKCLWEMMFVFPFLLSGCSCSGHSIDIETTEMREENICSEDGTEWKDSMLPQEIIDILDYGYINSEIEADIASDGSALFDTLPEAFQSILLGDISVVLGLRNEEERAWLEEQYQRKAERKI